MINVAIQKNKMNCDRVLFQSTFTSYKQTPSQLLKFAENFETALLQEHARVSSFSQPERAITREQNVINFDGYLIYGGHFMNCHVSDMHIRLYKNIASNP